LLSVAGLVAGLTLVGFLAKLSLAQNSPKDPPLSSSTTEPAAVIESEDPEQVVKAFIEQNQKQAQSQLKKLKDEGDKLRARLQKVEASIKRWETYLTALKPSQAIAPPMIAEAPKAVIEPGPADIQDTRTEIHELAPIAPSAPPPGGRPSEPGSSTPKVPEPSLPRR
jgi:hypothetical protein